MPRIFRNNYVTVRGEITVNPELHHESNEKKFYFTNISVKRRSGTIDTIPLLIPEELLEHLGEGEKVELKGEIRSYGIRAGDRRISEKFLFVKEAALITEEELMERNNRVSIQGTVRRDPRVRETTKGTRIADVSVAATRPNGRPDIIPCICWGDDAESAADIKAGDRVNVYGRLQSRTFTPRTEEESPRTVIEVSAAVLRKITDRTERNTAEENTLDEPITEEGQGQESVPEPADSVKEEVEVTEEELNSAPIPSPDATE